MDMPVVVQRQELVFWGPDVQFTGGVSAVAVRGRWMSNAWFDSGHMYGVSWGLHGSFSF